MEEPALPTVHAETAHEEHHPELLGLDAEGWVYVSLTLFLLFMIFYVKAHRLIAKALDKRIADTRRELDEAEALRKEAEKLLAEAKEARASASKDAEAILANARTEAGELLEEAERDAAALLERRREMAEHKIAAAERAAVDELRATAARAATRAAPLHIDRHHGPAEDQNHIDRTIP
ncbi:MAG: hypothetical protein ACFBQW_01605, partial [Sphingomonadaceae bacterium]